MPRQPLPEPPRPFTDPFWRNQPNVVGLHMPLYGDADGVAWRAVVESDYVKGRKRQLIPAPDGSFYKPDDIGWVRVVSLTVGAGAEADRDVRTNEAKVNEGRPDVDGWRPDVLDTIDVAAREARLAARTFEDTRRLIVDASERASNTTTDKRNLLDVEVKSMTDRERALIASHVIELLVRDYGIDNPGPWLDRFLRMSEPTRKRIVDRALALGFLPPRTRGRFRPESWDGYSATRSPDGRIRPKRTASKPKGAKK